MSDINVVTRDEYEKDIKRIDEKNNEQDKRLLNHEGRISANEKSLATLSGLADKVDAIRQEQARTNSLIEQMSKKMEEVIIEAKKTKQDIDRQKERGKVDLLKLVTDNFWQIITALMAGYLVFSQIFQ